MATQLQTKRNGSKTKASQSVTSFLPEMRRYFKSGATLDYEFRKNQLKKLKRENPDRIVGVTGCMAQKEAEGIHERLPHVDLVLGTRAILACRRAALERIVAPRLTELVAVHA